MIISESKLQGLSILEPELREDERGFFTRIFAKEELKKHNIDFDIVHINHSFNIEKGILRGMHYQKDPHEEIKIVQCLKGSIFDVAIDMRAASPTFGKWFSIELTEQNRRMLYIPKGFAHGFQTLENNTLVQYFMSEYYYPESATGIRWNDPHFNILWPLANPILAEKDNQWQLFKK